MYYGSPQLQGYARFADCLCVHHTSLRWAVSVSVYLDLQDGKIEETRRDIVAAKRLEEPLVEASRSHRRVSYLLHSACFSVDAINSAHGPYYLQNAFAARGTPGQSRKNAFSALAEPSQSSRFAQNSISQRVSYPAAQRNSLCTAPANAFGGPSSQGNFQSPARPRSPAAPNNSAFRGNSNAFNGSNAFSSSNAFSNSNNAFSGSGYGGSSRRAQPRDQAAGTNHAFARGAATPQPSGSHRSGPAKEPCYRLPEPKISRRTGEKSTSDLFP